MSESEDDAAFASADEGEVPAAVAADPVMKETSKEKPNDPESHQTKTANESKGKRKNKKKKNAGGKSNANESSKQPVQTCKKSEVKVTSSENDKSQEPSTSNKNTSDSSKKDSLTNPKQSRVDTSELKESNSNTSTDLTATSSDTSTDTSQCDSLTSSKQTSLPAKSDGKSDPVNKVQVVTESPGIETIIRTVDKDCTEEENAPSNTTEESSGSWGWGGWGSSLLKTATNSVSTFTHQVGDGLTTLMDTVETTLGVPSPEDMVEKHEKLKENEDETQKKDVSDAVKPDQDTSKTETHPVDKPETQDNVKVSESGASEASSTGGGWFSNISHLVQNTVTEGMGVLETIGTGSLDVMEKIGKKTYSVMTEHDPGFRKAREVLGHRGDKPTLSAVLRDAKEDAEKKVEYEKESDEARQSHFGFLFDEYQGIAHLEALEMLSNQSEKKVQALLHAMPDDALTKIKPQLLKIKEIFEIEDRDDDEVEEQDFVKLITEQLSDLHLGTSPEKLKQLQEKAENKLKEFNRGKENDDESEVVTYMPKEIHRVAMQCLADLSSKSVEQFHKAGELILLHKDTEKTFEERSQSLARLTQILCNEVGILSTKFSQCLNTMAEEDGSQEELINPLVTIIYLEASNSSTYIQDAFQLLLPVVQHAVIQNSEVLQ